MVSNNLTKNHSNRWLSCWLTGNDPRVKSKQSCEDWHQMPWNISNCGIVKLLAFFDACAAFDIVDHGLLLTCFSPSYGIVGWPLDCPQFFLDELMTMVTLDAYCTCCMYSMRVVLYVLFGVPLNCAFCSVFHWTVFLGPYFVRTQHG